MEQIIPTIGPMPALGLGTWRLSGPACTQSVKLALDLGYRHIDTAQVYHNHEAIAEGIQGFPREQLYLVSKIIEDDLRPNRVLAACERCLSELKTPYLDLLLIHWPSDTIPSEETLASMVLLKERGLVKNIGVSNYMISHLQPLENHHFPILANQIEMHPYLQEDQLVRYCQQHNIIVVAYRPIQRAEVMKERMLQEYGEKYQKTPIQITLRWLFQKNVVSIPKATSLEHLKANLEIFDFSLSDKEMKSIANLNINQRFVV
jgi:2,5-diketo-D-gluconate reductase B